METLPLFSFENDTRIWGVTETADEGLPQGTQVDYGQIIYLRVQRAESESLPRYVDFYDAVAVSMVWNWQ